jgi:Zn-dependent protease/predicted transcriptional regulator
VSKIYPLTSIAGIAIRAQASSAFAFAILLIVLATLYLPGFLPEAQAQTRWAVAFLSTLALFLSTLARELARCIIARQRGMAVQSITFMVFGCVSDVRRDGERALDEALISGGAPLISLVIAGVIGLILALAPGLSEPLVIFLFSVFLLNLWVGLFNLLPALPLDGGRALRGILWHWTGDFARATWIASTIGRVFAAVFFLAGLALLVTSFDEAQRPFRSILGYEPRMVGIGAMLLAWFLNSGARGAQRQLALQGRFQGVTVSDIMTAEPPMVNPWTSIGELVATHFVQTGERAVAVVRDNDLLVGLVAYSDVQRVPRGEWGSHGAGEVMTAVKDLITVAPEDQIDVAVRYMAEKHLNQLPVVKNGRLVGMVARVNVLRFISPKDDPAKV